MKKNILLILSFITLILCIYNIRYINNINYNLQGYKINEFLYFYKLDTNNSTLNGFTYQNNNLYYLLNNNSYDKEKYIFTKLNIYNNKKQAIKEIDENNSNCFLMNSYLTCHNTLENKNIIYNLNYEKIYEYQTKDNVVEEYIPYKDTFINISDNKIYIKNIVVSELNENLLYVDFYKTNNNTYILFFNNTDNSFSLFNLNKKENQKINYSYCEKYENGFYFYNNEKIIIYDLNNDKLINYEIDLNEFDFTISALSFNNESFYLIDSFNTIYKINLKDNTIKDLNVEEFINKDISTIKIYNNLMFIEIADNNKSDMYIIDLLNIEEPIDKINEYIKKQEANIKNKIYNLENNYNIKINIKENTDIEFPDFSINILDNNNIIDNDLSKIETILKKNNKEFFESFKYDDYEGLNIYLTSVLIPKNLDSQIANPAAYSLVNDNKYMIVIDGTQDNIEELFCHELLHNLENKIKDTGKIFTSWSNYNPLDFNYNNSYTKEVDEKYTLNYELDKDNVYFISSYSYTYEEEDRAEIFSSVCSCNTSYLKEYNNLYQKALYLKEEILNNYPMLKNTNLFKSLA